MRDAAGDRLVEEPARPVSEEEIARVHDPAYVEVLDEAEARGGGSLDPDTYVVPGSVAAARTAAGATVRAAVVAHAGQAEVAFAAVRPPGHHAARDRGSGFCLINSVAIAVATLRAAGVERVAIVDWDVHHGDGTQAIFEADPAVLYTSTHQFPFYPGSGAAAERGIGAGMGTSINRPLLAGDGDDAFVAAWTDELLPAVEDFGPGAIVVSAGYDGHAADPLAELTITEAGYETVARALGAVAARLAIPGVALTLEGGYDLDALRASVAATIRGLVAGREQA